MELVDYEIDKYVKKGIIGISPYSPDNIQPNSYDVHLGNHFIVFSEWDRERPGVRLPALEEPIDIKDPDALQKLFDSGHAYEVTTDTFIMHPGDAVLAHTVEVLTLPSHIRSTVNGKSSLARWFLEVHATGAFVDAGFSGQITLEMTLGLPSLYPLRIHAGMAIAQLSFTKTEECMIPYNMRKGAKYNNQMGATPSSYYKNYEG